MRSDTTRLLYARIVEDLTRSIEFRDEGAQPEAYGREIVRRRLRKASRNVYRAACFIHLRWDDEAIARFNASFGPYFARPLRADRTTYKSAVGADVLRAVLDVMVERRSVWGYAARTHDLVLATVLFGLRPCEWAATSWTDEHRRVLRIRNGKYADTVLERGPFAGRPWRRANGRHREIELPGELEDRYRAVAEAAMSGERDRPWETFQRIIRWTHASALGEAVRSGAIGERSVEGVTLYSYRHTFAANAKASVDVSSGEVAALMGHVSITTAQRSYAPRRNGRGTVRLRASAGSVEQVANRVGTALDASSVLGVDAMPGVDPDDEVLEPFEPMTGSPPVLEVEPEPGASGRERPRPGPGGRARG